MEDIVLLNILVLGGIALAAAVILYFVSQKFAVADNPKVAAVEECLPQANCGGCGKAGCHDFANACAQADEASFAALYCPVGGARVMKQIADILGYATVEKAPTVSVLRCNGTCEKAPAKVCYDGVSSCRIAARISSGQTGCPDGCLRLGDCVKVCRFDALHIDPVTGIPVVDRSKCTSCGACVTICPRHLFEIRPVAPDGSQVYVACRNTQKGAVARKNCSAACIACLKCTRINPEVKVENNLSYIPDTVDPREYGEALAAACPTGAIIFQRAAASKENPDD